MTVENVFNNNHTRMLDELLSYACVSHEEDNINVYSIVLCCVEFDVYALPLHAVFDDEDNYKYTHFMVYDMKRAHREAM